MGTVRAERRDAGILRTVNFIDALAAVSSAVIYAAIVAVTIRMLYRGLRQTGGREK